MTLTRKTPLARTSIRSSRPTGILAQASFQKSALKPAKRSTLKSKQRDVTATEKAYWSRLASEVGCVACMRDGNFNPHVSIHHIDGRTKPGCHMRVLPLCAGHHQDGTGEDKSMVAVHPWKAQFEARYGAQDELQARCDMRLGLNDGSLHVMGAA
jgi:hypothetical protein